MYGHSETKNTAFGGGLGGGQRRDTLRLQPPRRLEPLSEASRPLELLKCCSQLYLLRRVTKGVLHIPTYWISGTVVRV